jgi:predicted PurR-regulated permease PerM
MRALFRIAITVMLTLLGLIILWRFQTIIALFVIALFITVSLQPAVDRLRNIHIPGAIAMLILYLFGIGLLVGAAILAFPVLTQEVQDLLINVNQHYRDLYTQITESGTIAETALNSLPPPATFPTILPGISREQITSFLVGTTTGVLDAASQIVLIAFLSIYLVLDQVRFERLWLSVVSPTHRTVARQIYHDIADSIGAYIRSEALQSLIALVFLFGIYRLIGLQYSLISALVVAILWLIPVIGGLFALVWIGLTGWLTSVPVMVIAVLATSGLLIFLEFWLQPRLYRLDRFGTILVLITMMILGRSFGLIGLLVAPPLATAVQVLFNSLLRLPGPGAGTLPELNNQPVQQIIQDEWQEMDLRLKNLRNAISREDVPPSTNDLFERLTALVDKTRTELQ